MPVQPGDGVERRLRHLRRHGQRMTDEPDEDELDEPEPTWSQPPAALLTAFRATESIEDIGVLLVDEGFDAVTVRVLSAWEHSNHHWSMPATQMPDAGRPTATAWRWLMSGWSVAYDAIADGAGVSRDVARERMKVLQHARLVYPDGRMSKFAQQALQATIRERIRRSSSSKRKDESKANPKDDRGGN
jgi:hypothetical protein